ncbi:MAG: hypothetical protein ACI815_001850, partial [Psychroserpens sp.]
NGVPFMVLRHILYTLALVTFINRSDKIFIWGGHQEKHGSLLKNLFGLLGYFSDRTGSFVSFF